MMISLGHNCFPALALRRINTFQPSLPFDFIGNRPKDYDYDLLNVYLVLSRLKENTLDIDDFISVNEYMYNELNFSLNHFYKSSHLNKYRITEHNEEFSSLSLLFRKRFQRLKNNFFNQPNLLFFSRAKGFKPNFLLELAAQSIINLNPLNHLIILGSHKYYQLSPNIEYICSHRRSSSVKRANIKHYISQLTPDTKSYYESFVPDTQ